MFTFLLIERVIVIYKPRNSTSAVDLLFFQPPSSSLPKQKSSPSLKNRPMHPVSLCPEAAYYYRFRPIHGPCFYFKVDLLRDYDETSREEQKVFLKEPGPFRTLASMRSYVAYEKSGSGVGPTQEVHRS